MVFDNVPVWDVSFILMNIDSFIVIIGSIRRFLVVFPPLNIVVCHVYCKCSESFHGTFNSMHYCVYCKEMSLVFPPLIYNCKQLHMCIIVLTNKVIYGNVIHHSQRHTSCVHNLYSFVAQSVQNTFTQKQTCI